MRYFLLSAAVAASFAGSTRACDLCGSDLPIIRLENRPGWHAGVSEQYTSYESLRLDGHDIPDSANQYLHSSITQIFAGYDFNRSFGVQVNVPLIYRSFRRVEEGMIQSGHVSGLGDVSLLAHWTPLRFERDEIRITGRLVAGIKFPTGDSDRLAEEGEHPHGGEAEAHEHEEGHEEEAEHEEEHHDEEGPASGVHGHDLALGTGSIDGIFGAEAHMEWRRLFVEAGVQVTVRSQGDHDYDFADDVSWRAGVGVMVWKSDDVNVGIEARFSGESKGEDKFRGQGLDDTAATHIFFGPRVVFTWKDQLGAEFGVEFPIARENTGTQIAPDLRLQASLGWQF